MRRFTKWAVAVIAGLCLVACRTNEDVDPGLTRISGVTIVDVSDGVARSDQDILFREDQIVWTGETGQAPLPLPGHTVDGRGLFAMPGLWDSHVHVFSTEEEPNFALPLYILHGLTSIRDMGALISFDDQMEVNAEIRSGERIGPRIINAGAMIDGPPGSWPGQMVATTPEEGLLRVREAAQTGWRSVKAYSLLDRATYLAIAAEADELGLPLYGHVPEGVTLADAVAAGQDVIEHFGRVTKACSTEEQAMIDGVIVALGSDAPFQALMAEMATHAITTLETWDADLCQSVVGGLAEANIAIAPTLMVSDFYLGNDPEPEDLRMQTVPLRIRAQWGEPDFRRAAMTEDLLAIAPEAVRQDWQTFKLAHDAGVVMLASSDAAFLNPFLFHGATLIDELERYVEIGLTPQEALITATVNPSVQFGSPGENGQIEPGQRADIILLRANPLKDISAVRQLQVVIALGRVFDRAALDDMEATLRKRANADAAE